ncbi:1973_t:CDS:2 [Paraglomus occultum]|uniref:1973_t:CDS:1 n=1 Tax=Paraglomus occultum TaxID=144539 RepID=A0A9N9FV85_9GLOM|nr:1973_t:CDS:2 [Paraglomus occultum]
MSREARPAVVEPMATRDWATVMQKMESYRNKLAKERRLYDPLYYYLIDHSGPTLPHCRPVWRILSKNEALSKHPNDTPVKTEKERNIKELVTSTFKAITKPGKDNLSEMERTSLENVLWKRQLIDENEGRDPYERARDGYKKSPAVCPRGKEWKDTLKLGLELRDIWRKAQKELGVHSSRRQKTSHLRAGWTLPSGARGRGGPPSSLSDLINLQRAYRVMLLFTDKLAMGKEAAGCVESGKIRGEGSVDNNG